MISIKPIRSRIALGTILCSVAISGCQKSPSWSNVNIPDEATTRPVGYDESNERFYYDQIEAAKGAHPRVVFLGDSITQGWMVAGKKSWEKHFVPLKSICFGVGGDKTQHVIWRLEHGQFKYASPDLVVLLIGTNNWMYEVEETIDGMMAILKKLRLDLPRTRILVLNVFPNRSGLRFYPHVASEALEQRVKDPMITFLSVDSAFRNAEGKVRREFFETDLHLSDLGYEAVAEAILPTVSKLLFRARVDSLFHFLRRPWGGVGGNTQTEPGVSST